jgi:hypothetical protein
VGETSSRPDALHLHRGALQERVGVAHVAAPGGDLRRDGEGPRDGSAVTAACGRSSGRGGERCRPPRGLPCVHGDERVARQGRRQEPGVRGRQGGGLLVRALGPCIVVQLERHTAGEPQMPRQRPREAVVGGGAAPQRAEPLGEGDELLLDPRERHPSRQRAQALRLGVDRLEVDVPGGLPGIDLDHRQCTPPEDRQPLARHTERGEGAEQAVQVPGVVRERRSEDPLVLLVGAVAVPAALPAGDRARDARGRGGRDPLAAEGDSPRPQHLRLGAPRPPPGVPQFAQQLGGALRIPHSGTTRCGRPSERA